MLLHQAVQRSLLGAVTLPMHRGAIAMRPPVLSGDGLLVYFGYPVAHEDDAIRAVYAGPLRTTSKKHKVSNARNIDAHERVLRVYAIICGTTIRCSRAVQVF